MDSTVVGIAVTILFLLTAALLVEVLRLRRAARAAERAPAEAPAPEWGQPAPPAASPDLLPPPPRSPAEWAPDGPWGKNARVAGYGPNPGDRPQR